MVSGIPVTSAGAVSEAAVMVCRVAISGAGSGATIYAIVISGITVSGAVA